MIRNIVFDIGMVLADFRYDAYMREDLGFPDHVVQARGYKVYLLSNYPRDAYKMHEAKHFDFASVVDGKVISGIERMSKPDPRIYRLLCERYSLIPGECVFLDDREVNIKAAIAEGMQGIVFTSYEDAQEKLEEILKK